MRGLIKRSVLIERLGGKCIKCGYSKNYSALHFHHRNPEDKKFQIDARKCNNTKMETLIEEASKCDLLCSNCHMEIHHPESDISLIDTYKGEIETSIRESTLDPSKLGNHCQDCGKSISYGAQRCVSCAKKLERKVDRPSKEELFNMITTMSFLEIGRKYGVTDNTIRKWCKGYDLPSTKRDLKNII